jgi:hypothetical protein
LVRPSRTIDALEKSVAEYDDLIKRAEQLGVPHGREHQLWIVAVISAVIAVLAAIAGACKDIWAS